MNSREKESIFTNRHPESHGINLSEATFDDYKNAIKDQQAKLKEIREAEKKALEAELEVRRRAIEAPIDESEVVDIKGPAQENGNNVSEDKTVSVVRDLSKEHGFIGVRGGNEDSGLFGKFVKFLKNKTKRLP